MISGLVISARPIAVACCSPPDSVPARLRRRALRLGKASITASSVHAPGAAGGAGEQQVLLDRQAGEQPATFRHQRDAHSSARVGAARRHVDAVEHDAPAGERVLAGDGAQQRRLAGAVGADQGDRLALADGEADAAHGGQQAVARLETLDRQQRHPGASAEIGFDHRRVGHHLVGRAVGDDAAGVHADQALGDAQQDMDDVLDPDDRRRRAA